MKYIGTFNINVQNKFLKLWYKKTNITLHDISLTKLEGPKEAYEEFLIGKITKISTNMIDAKSWVELEEEKL